MSGLLFASPFVINASAGLLFDFYYPVGSETLLIKRRKHDNISLLDSEEINRAYDDYTACLECRFHTS